MTSLPQTASAQRTLEKQDIVTVGAVTSCRSWKDSGVRASWGRYALTWYWKGWADACRYGRTVGHGDTMDYGHLTFGADFMYRLVSTRSRSVSLYAGGGPLLGVEGYGLWKPLPEWYVADLPKARFIYGVQAALECEIFIARKVALTLSGTVPVTAGSLMRTVHPQLGAGIRVAL